MSVSTLADSGFPIPLDDEIEGEEIGSRNYRFSKIGEPVPISSDTFEFDAKCLPSQPLAVSERFRLLFVVHPHGFYVTRTAEVMVSAEQIKNKEKGKSLQELCLLDVPLENVSMLCLSSDDSMVAATVGSHAHFFSVGALLHKEQKPSFSVTLDDSDSIKEMKWSRKVAKAYVILSACGKLFYGAGHGPLSCVMESVDSVDWNVKGNFVAVAKKNIISILSSEFKERLSFSLQFHSVIGDRDSDVNQVVKVDSVRWIRSDCIVVGWFELNEDGVEENYVVQLITSKHGRITDATSDRVVLSFNNVFVDFCSDAVPIRRGPYLLLNYLDHYGLAFIANRNLSQHVRLFSWSLENGKNEATSIEILNDAWTLYIDSQGNGEENVILGVCVDKVSPNENAKLALGDMDTEVSPSCVIVCLTIDGKISVFHFASASGALLSPEDSTSDKEDNVSLASLKHELPQDRFEESGVQAFSNSKSQIVSMNQEEKTNDKATVAGNNILKSLVCSQPLKLDESAKPLSVISNQENVKENQSMSNVKSSKDSFSEKSVENFSFQPVPHLKERVVNPTTSAGRFRTLASDSIDGSSEYTLQTSGSVLRGSSDWSEKAKPSPETAFGLGGSTGLGNSLSVSQKDLKAGKSVKPEFYKDPFSASTLTGFPNFGQNVSKNFGNVEGMAKKLDILLEGIEGKGGFSEASVTSQEASVVELEDYMGSLSNKCRMWRGLMDERLRDVHILLDKTVQVLGRKIYLEGIFKQNSDSRYWQLWNYQKLGSELELKRKHVLDLNQGLANQMIELERHFNSLEFNKFGVDAPLQRSWRSPQNSHAQSRKMQSLHGLHDTMNAQLAAAEQLSGFLSKQMAALSIGSCEKKHDAKKQLFESIGLSYVGDSHVSPDRNRAFDILSQREQFADSRSISVKQQSKRNQSDSPNYKLETARRRRDSLDQSWASFDPPKTTLKRTLLKEDNEKGSATRSRLNIDEHYLNPQSQKKIEMVHSEFSDTSANSLNLSGSKGTSVVLAQQFSERPIPLFEKKSGLFDNEIEWSSIKKDSVLSPPSISKSLTMTKKNEVGTSEVNDEELKSNIIFPERSSSFPVRARSVVQQSKSSFSLRPGVSMPEQPPTSPSHSIGSLDRFKIELTKSTTGECKNEPVLADTKFTAPKFPTVPASFSSALNESDRGLSDKSFSNPSQPSNDVSASTSLQSIFGSSPLGNISSSLPSTLSPGSNPLSTSLSSHYVDSTPLKSSIKSSAAMYGSKTEGVFQTQASVINTLSTEKGAKTQASPSQPVFGASISDFKPESSASLAFTQLSTGLKSVNEMDIGLSSNHSPVVTSIVNLEKPYSVEDSGGIVGSTKNLISDSSQEEEMEEEATETDQITELDFGSLGGFGVSSTPGKQNPFGAASLNKVVTPITSSFTIPAPAPTGELFRPASFNFQSAHAVQPLQPTPAISFSSGFNTGNLGQTSSVSGFGQPANIGSGQQALGSVLGTFGQSRQLGAGLPGSSVTGNGVAGGLMGNTVGNAGGGFPSASTFGGFASLAAGGGGGFASAAIPGGQFAAAASAGVGFQSAASTPAFSGGFGAFSNQQGSGLSGFGGGSGTARPPSQLFTQMRK